MKPILIDCSLTGGRGPAKKAYELTKELTKAQIPWLLITDKGFKQKLADLNIRVDYTVNTSLNENPEKIINDFYKVIKNIDYSFMVKLGARVAGPTASLKLNKPYVIADGGLPDKLSNRKDLYNKTVFNNAEKYFITTQFDWKFPNKLELKNVKVCCYPISTETFNFLSSLKKQSKLQTLNKVSSNIQGELPRKETDLLINLVMTGDYLTPENRITYNGWLTTKQYDQSVGFIRRLFTDFGENFKKLYIFMDIELTSIISDLIIAYPNIRVLTFNKAWDYKTELAMKAASDLTISRATNYQPYIAALNKGGNITTPVPANGYMDEDTAGIQYEEQGLTKLINYDDEKYIFKLKEFLNNEDSKISIQENLEAHNFIRDRNLNKLIIDFYNDFLPTQ